MPSQTIVRCKLSFGSFVKLSVIVSIGVLPVLALLVGGAILIHPGQILGLSFSSLTILSTAAAFEAAGFVFSTIVAGIVGGALSYPFYWWLCRKRGGLILKGNFE
jgi:hypothetical protein